MACSRNKSGVLAIGNIYIQRRKIFPPNIFQLLHFSGHREANREGALWHLVQAHVRLVPRAAASCVENKNHGILDIMNLKVFF